MSDICLAMAEDDYESYYSEKIWEMIPEYYRHEDGVAFNPDVLRSLVEVVAQQVARVRRSHDQLWQDQSIEHCQDWAIPYIGDLVATRLLPALNQRGRRIDVAKTIYYRRRKGTLGVLEELISDITGWEGKVVESFRRLARHRHGLDAPIPLTRQGNLNAQPLLGRYSQTPQGGTANLRTPYAGDLVDGPFNEFFHTPDFRQHSGKLGRFNIPKLAFHIYRLHVYPLRDIDPFQLDERRFAFDPSGREIPLYCARNRDQDWHNWRSALPWELPAHLTCRLLNHAEYVVTQALLNRLQTDLGVSVSAINALSTLMGLNHPSEASLRTMLSYLAQPELANPAVDLLILQEGLIEQCGKARLLPDVVAVKEGGLVVEPVRSGAANLSLWPLAVADKRLLIDPERGLMQFFGDAPSALLSDYHYATPMDFAAGSHARMQVEFFSPTTELSGGGRISALQLHDNGITQINDSRNYGPLADKLAVQNLALQAANHQRPYIAMQANWELRADVVATVEQGDAMVRLDGLWFGSSVENSEIVFRGDGDYESITISHCTVDPGGMNDIAGNPVWPVDIVVEAKVEKLIITHSIVGSIRVRGNGLLESIEITDSIVDGAAHAELTGDASPDSTLAIEAPHAVLRLQRVTVIGEIAIKHLWASDSILTHTPDVEDTQQGCFRFSAAPMGSLLPKPYRSFFFAAGTNLFQQRFFSHPDYARLAPSNSDLLLEGGENGAEMGVFNSLIQPIKESSLRSKINEYMPFGLVPSLIYEN